jgi:SAM-dependent methyltransferase
MTHRDMEAKCRICSSVGKHEIYRAREMMFGTREEFDYFQCSNCGCLQIVNIPSNLDRYYPPHYYSFRPVETNDTANPIYRFLQKQRTRNALFGRGYKLNRLLSRLVPFPPELNICGPIVRRAGIKSFNAPILDVGCGSQSWWLSHLKKLGFSNLLGIDPFVAKDAKVNRVPILKKDITEVSGRFLLITFHHSFEHIANPYKVLQTVKSLLTPQGVCLLRLPVVSSYAWEKYGVNWVELDAPRHFFLYSTRSIEILINKVGLDLFDVVYDSDWWEFVGSEQYVHDIPLIAENSYFVDPQKSIFSPEEIECFKKEAERVNREKRAGRAGFYLRVARRNHNGAI